MLNLNALTFLLFSLNFFVFIFSKSLLCSVCCKPPTPFCFCPLPKLHSRLEGLRADRRSHRTYDSRVTIPHPKKIKQNQQPNKTPTKMELLSSANLALCQELKLLAYSFSLVFPLVLLSLTLFSVEAALSNTFSFISYIVCRNLLWMSNFVPSFILRGVFFASFSSRFCA